MKHIHCRIEGTSPILMNRFVQVEGIDKKTPEEQAEIKTYRTPDGDLYIPGDNIKRCLINAATYSKGKGRATLKKEVAACVIITPEYCLLIREGKLLKDTLDLAAKEEYKVDIRPGVNPVTRGRILIHRARFDDWSIEFDLEYDELLLKGEQVRRVVDDAGRRVGLLDFRPEKLGSFGRFVVVDWKRVGYYEG